MEARRVDAFARILTVQGVWCRSTRPAENFMTGSTDASEARHAPGARRTARLRNAQICPAAAWTSNAGRGARCEKRQAERVTCAEEGGRRQHVRSRTETCASQQSRIRCRVRLQRSVFDAAALERRTCRDGHRRVQPLGSISLGRARDRAAESRQALSPGNGNDEDGDARAQHTASIRVASSTGSAVKAPRRRGRLLEADVEEIGIGYSGWDG
jgi:hypothetical protein